MAEQFTLADHPHRRYNALTGDWVLVSPHRARRPWQGQMEDAAGEPVPHYDPYCYLCPGNIRAGNAKNPPYTSTFVFTNDFSALLPETPGGLINTDGLLVASGEKGICRVVCFSPRHDLTLAGMATEQIKMVVDVWEEEYRSLGSQPFINYVQIFENRGQMMGSSNPHPHGQIWAQESIPGEPSKELTMMMQYSAEHGGSLLADYLALEVKLKERIVAENRHFVALVPFWAVWPFETLIISRRVFGSLSEMTEEERRAFAEILKHLTGVYDALFHVSFPYSAGLHQTPTDGKEHPGMHFHMHFYPPLLRSATVKKFMVGYELMADPQRDITPETSAERLRSALPQ